MEERLNTPHTDKIELDFLGHRLQLSQDPNSKHLGTTVWDSSMVFIKFLEQNCKKGELSHSKLAGKRVIELGAGCGLAGLGMALLGCHVVATDQVEVLPLLMRNLERNMSRAKHSPSESPFLGSRGTVEVAELNWGDKDQIKALNPPFDYVIGSDIVYKEKLLEPLVATMVGLAGPKTTILVANEYRSSMVHERMLQLWKDNFNMKIISRSKMDPVYQHECIQLFSLKSKGTSASLMSEVTPKGEETTDVKSEREKSEGVCENMSESHATKKSSSSGQIMMEAVKTEEGKGQRGDLSDWEIRRLGSMAARLLQEVPYTGT